MTNGVTGNNHAAAAAVAERQRQEAVEQARRQAEAQARREAEAQARRALEQPQTANNHPFAERIGHDINLLKARLESMIDGGACSQVRRAQDEPLKTQRAEKTLGPGDQSELARRYAPILYLHPEEQFEPGDPNSFIRESSLKVKGINLTLIPEGQVKPSMLGQIKSDEVYLDHADDNAARRGDAETAPFLYHYNAEKREITYPLFYPHNKKDGGRIVPGVDGSRLHQEHEGDWEYVKVRLDENYRPLEVEYSNHKNKLVLPWSDVPKEGGRPVVYVARGSHANSPSPENRELPSLPRIPIHPSVPGSIPLSIYAAFSDKWDVSLRGVGPKIEDEFAAGGKRIDTQARLSDINDQPWYEFRGDWGEQKSFLGLIDIDDWSGPAGPSSDWSGFK